MGVLIVGSECGSVQFVPSHFTEGLIDIHNRVYIKVKWEGYDSDDTTWEPYHRISHIRAAQEFIRNHIDREKVRIVFSMFNLLLYYFVVIHQFVI